MMKEKNEEHFHQGAFRAILRTRLLQHCRKNPRYSLRAFARSLGVEVSALSKILRGKRSVSRSMFRRLKEHLALKPTELVSIREDRGDDFTPVSHEDFSTIAQWYHYAILEMIQLKKFRHEPQWMAHSLGITVPEVSEALERLHQLGYIKQSPSGRWKLLSGGITTIPNKFTSAAFREHEIQVLEKAILAIEEIPFEERDQSSMTMAIDARKITEAKQMLLKFRREFCRSLEATGEKNAVYYLSISLFPVVNLTKGRK